jgi:hypothetical protein
MFVEVIVLFPAFPNLFFSLLTVSLSEYVFLYSGEHVTNTGSNPDLRMNTYNRKLNFPSWFWPVFRSRIRMYLGL